MITTKRKRLPKEKINADYNNGQTQLTIDVLEKAKHYLDQILTEWMLNKK